jgi:hypothetical protein
VTKTRSIDDITSGSKTGDRLATRRAGSRDLKEAVAKTKQAKNLENQVPEARPAAPVVQNR